METNPHAPAAPSVEPAPAAPELAAAAAAPAARSDNTPTLQVRRPHDWPERLRTFLEARETAPFDWATHNCCLFAADWVRELTGIDPAAKYRDQVKTEEDAKALLAKKGGVLGLIKRTAKAHGWEEVPRHYAQRGDLILFDGPLGKTLGICTGPSFAAAAPDSLTHIDMKHALRAWRIA